MSKNIIFGTLFFSPWDIFSNMDACKSFSKYTRKMNLQSILNKNSPWTHMELEFDVSGVTVKLVKYEH
jgi:hypothetical protein